MADSATAIVVAAGAGVRMGAGVPKALMPLAGRPLVAWAAGALAASPGVGALVVVGPADRLGDLRRALAGVAPGAEVVAGGASRAGSVREGLAAARGSRVLVHDAARPLASPELVAAVLGALDDGADGAVAASPLPDTLKRAGGDMVVEATVERAGLWRAETPQAFPAEVLREAVRRAEREGRLEAATDCASMVEAAGGRVRLVPSGSPNPKVTTPADLPLAEALLASRAGGARGRC